MSEPARSWVNVSVDEAAGVVDVELCRPAALNALDAAMLAELDAVAAQLRGLGGRARAVVLRGAGPRAFAAGADLAEMAATVPAVGGGAAAAATSARGQAVLDAWAQLPMPTLAAVHGFCLGGGLELALACDLIFAAQSATFGLPEVGLGLVPGFGGTVRLPARIGVGAAAHWILTAGKFSAAEAHRVGLVQTITAEAELLPQARAQAAALAAGAPAAQAAAKRLLLAAAADARRAGLADEARCFGERLAGAEGQEGVAAFLARRPPQFHNPAARPR